MQFCYWTDTSSVYIPFVTDHELPENTAIDEDMATRGHERWLLHAGHNHAMMEAAPRTLPLSQLSSSSWKLGMML